MPQPPEVATTAWTPLLDAAEERMRRLCAVLDVPAPRRPGETMTLPEPGPAFADADRPTQEPTPQERLRLLALLDAHEQALDRLRQRRIALDSARRYTAATR